MEKLPKNKRRKLIRIINQLKGKVFTLRDSNGKEYRMAVHGIKGDYVVVRQVQAGSSRGRLRILPFFFLFPFFFFFPFL